MFSLHHIKILMGQIDLHFPICSWGFVKSDVDVQPGKLSDAADGRGGAGLARGEGLHGLRRGRLQGPAVSSVLQAPELIAGVRGEREDCRPPDVRPGLAVEVAEGGGVPVLATQSGLHTDLRPPGHLHRHHHGVRLDTACNRESQILCGSLLVSLVIGVTIR